MYHPIDELGDKRICPQTGRAFTLSFSAVECFDSCDSCRPDAPSLAARLGELNRERAGMKLTKLEREILQHRLTVPDCIADVLEESEDIDAICGALLAGDFAAADAISRAITAEVLVECIEGSTYCGAASELSPQKLAAIHRAADSLAAKVSQYVGREIIAVHY